MMRLLFILIVVGSIFPARGQSVHIQSDMARTKFENDIRKADSLAGLKHFKRAFVIYKARIDDLLSGKLQVEISADQWESVLRRAADMGWRCDNTNLAVRYNNMALGTKGEKLREKIEFLAQLDVEQYYIYLPSSIGGTGHSLVVGGCSLSDTRYLIWFHKDKCFVQKFDDCESYKPAQFTDTALYNLFDSSSEEMIGEKITRLKVGYNHVMHYSITFPSDSGEVSRRFSINDVSEYKAGSKEYKRLSEVNQLDQYLHNMQTKLKLFNEYSYALIEKYNKFLNSAVERQKVGKL
ncbi:hypothetical protein [Pedobacter psychroterrae]|uniref:Uncharacterized protein n=1 Tax=Pedobacter psychroterrae TaxID=2530453 RepID=A0A4R0NKP9_9SPHI|nr:hypothetical protein [Pedobacter psychroterrae]TCD01301.1 hypothetical protein EZ437_11155 [Pedobacter psychroterrae]